MTSQRMRNYLEKRAAHKQDNRPASVRHRGLAYGAGIGATAGGLAALLLQGAKHRPSITGMMVRGALGLGTTGALIDVVRAGDHQDHHRYHR